MGPRVFILHWATNSEASMTERNPVCWRVAIWGRWRTSRQLVERNACQKVTKTTSCSIIYIQQLFNDYCTYLGEGNGSPLYYSCLENLVDRGAWWVAVHRVTQSQTRLKQLSMHALRRKWQPTPVFLPGESQEQRSLVGCCLWGHTESGTTGAT